MKVCFLTALLSRHAGGLYHSVRGLAKAVSATGASVEVLGTEDQALSEDVAAWAPLPVRALPVHGPARFSYAPRLNAALDQAGADVVSSHGLWRYTSKVAHSWNSRTRRPLVVHPHGMLDPWAVGNARWKKRLAGWLYENAHLRAAACLRALCESEARAFRDHGCRNPICIIPNGVELPDLAAPVGPPPWQGKIPEGSRVLFSLGRLHPKKGLTHLLAALAVVRPEFERAGWRLVVAGWDEGGHEAVLRRQVEELGLDGLTHFCGGLIGGQKAAALRHAAAFVLPSFSEGLPMAILEAWAHGLPVVMTPGCNLPEGFTAGAAICAEPDARAIATSLRHLVALPEALRAEMGTRGRRLVEEQFNWPRIGAQMRGVFDWTLGGGAPPPWVALD